MTSKKEYEAQLEGFKNRYAKALGEMTHVNWVVLRKELQLNKEEILSDTTLALVFVLWAEGERTPDALNALLNTAERELWQGLGVDYEAMQSYAAEDAA